MIHFYCVYWFFFLHLRGKSVSDITTAFTVYFTTVFKTFKLNQSLMSLPLYVLLLCVMQTSRHVKDCKTYASYHQAHISKKNSCHTENSCSFIAVSGLCGKLELSAEIPITKSRGWCFTLMMLPQGIVGGNKLFSICRWLHGIFYAVRNGKAALEFLAWISFYSGCLYMLGHFCILGLRKAFPKFTIYCKGNRFTGRKTTVFNMSP